VSVKRLSFLLLLFAAFGLFSRAAAAQNSAAVLRPGLRLGILASEKTAAQVTAPDQANLLRATLPNGMRVVIIRSTLAPVVTVEANFLVGGNETPTGISRHGPRAGAHGLSRLHGHDGRSDIGDLCATGRRKQRRHAAEHYPVLCHRAVGRPGRGARGASGLPARHRQLPEGVAGGAGRHRAGGGARPFQPHLQIHESPE
jgi:hypothetical protein